ncbi:MAG: TerC family protein [Deltaproteobacteria bacterium]|nr:TerC family protein [Deltaproteobacteria bacterium]
MEQFLLFPFQEYWWFYLGFTLFVFMMLALDLGVFHRKAHEVSFKEAATWSVVWVTLALVFNYLFYRYALWDFSQEASQFAALGINPAEAAKKVGLEFLTGYVVEKSLAVDNIFIFVVVFSYFAIPSQYQHRILFYGILGALFFRVIFIALGSILMQYQAIVIIFGAFLIFTGIKMMFAGDEKIEPEKNPVIRLMKRFLRITPKIEGQKFFVRKEGLLYATPLLVCLVFLELTDIIFAVDSVPAIFALTKEPLIVYTSNVFAILGLRSMYFMLAGVIDKFHLLKYGLALVLVFVGLKMVWLNEAFGGKFPISWSLGIIGSIITTSIVASLLIKKKDKTLKSKKEV